MILKNKYWQNEAEKKPNGHISIEHARVHSITPGGARLIFLGESAPSEKVYPGVDSYVARVGQRVILIDGIIIGGRTPSRPLLEP